MIPFNAPVSVADRVFDSGMASNDCHAKCGDCLLVGHPAFEICGQGQGQGDFDNRRVGMQMGTSQSQRLLFFEIKDHIGRELTS